jgi:hypothetical protein
MSLKDDILASASEKLIALHNNETSH